MFKRILVGSGIFLGFLIVVVICLMLWRDRVIARRSGTALMRVESLLSNATPREALAHINSRPPSGGDEAADARWLAAEVEACARLGLVGRLQTLYRQAAEVVLENEDAALMLARAFLHGGDEVKGLGLAERWDARTTRPELWFAFRVDAALLNGRRAEALELVTDSKFDGPGDSLRLSRLALLTARDDLPKAWDLLAAAYEADPRDIDVRSFRGQILEGLGSNRLARVEYVAAHVASPGNVMMRDQLAEFYRRRGNLLNALETWLPGLSNSPPAYLHLKAVFWSRVARPLPMPALEGSATDPLAELVRYLSGVGSEDFWNADDFELLAGRSLFERTRQEVYWLRLLQLLKDGKTDAAMEMSRVNPFRGRAYDSLLDRALYAVLSYRKHGRLDAYGVEFPPETGPDNRHEFLVTLDRHARLERAARRPLELPAELEAVLRQEAAPALVLMTAGWLRGGLDVLGEAAWPEAVPAWVPFAVTQTKRLVEGVPAALAYVTKQPGSPELVLLSGELQLANGQTDAGLKTLSALVTGTGSVGYRAAWLAANARLERGEHGRLAAVIAGQPQLSSRAVGQELLARSALAQGATNQAETIYAKIVGESVEAKAHLARLAFARKDWKKARELTEALLLAMPDELALRRNLEAIAEAESASR